MVYPVRFKAHSDLRPTSYAKHLVGAFLYLVSLLNPSGLAQAAGGPCPWKQAALTPSQLVEVLEDHRRWLVNPNDGWPANLCETNLRLADIQGADLRRANLRGANLEAVDITGINLSGANLQGANLQDASFDSANFKNADLSGANLQRISITGSDLRFANLTGSDLSQCALAGNRFDNAKFEGANLSQCDVRKAILNKALLANANLYQAQLDEAKLSQVDLQSANLEQANLTNTDLSQSNLTGANLSQAILRGTQLKGVALSQANLNDTLYLAQGRPDPNAIAGLRGLRSLRLVPASADDYYTRKEILDSITKPTAGIQRLRQALHSAGETELEKEVSYLIAKNSNSFRSLPVRFMGFLLFDWTSDYGMHPQRPLRRLLELSLGFALLYLIPLAGFGRSGINRLWKGPGPIDRLERATHRWRKQRFQTRSVTLPAYALLFSLASILWMGGKGLPWFGLTGSLGKRPYTLRSTGWVTIATGLQCALSLYLIASWAWLNLAPLFRSFSF